MANEIHERIARYQRDLKELTDKKRKRLKEIQSFRYQNRRFFKLIVSIIPIASLSVLTYIISMYGIIPIAVAPVISVFGGRVIGGLSEYMLLNKFSKSELEKFEDFNDESSREKREIQLKLEKEKAKCDEYINEYEYNHTLINPIKSSSNSTVNMTAFDNSKSVYKDNLRRINTKLVLERDYSIYKSKLEAILYHLGLTAGWSIPFGLLYAITSATMMHTLTPLNLLLGFGVSALYNGYINYEILTTRLKQYNKYRKDSKMRIKDENLDTLRELQKEYIDKIGNIELIQKYDLSVNKSEERELNTDPIEKQYDYSLDSFAQQIALENPEIYDINKYQKPKSRRRVNKK